MATTPLSPQLFSILSSLVEERAGLHYEVSDAGLFADKIWPRAREAGFESLLDYYYFLRYDPAAGPELDALVEALVVNETYLFRELEPLRVLVDDVLAPLVAAGRRPRVWSAACSTGEEPVTLALLLESRGLGGQVELVASDVSRKVLEKARKGRWSRRSVRGPVPEFARDSVQLDDSGTSVAPAITARVDWRRVNLLDAAAVAALGRFDAILCRNVLIYFRESLVVAVVERLGQALAPGGLLLVGVSESLLRFGTSLDCVEQRGVFLYRSRA